MKHRRGQYRKVAINTLIAILISLVLNFSYLVFVMVGAEREPAPQKPIKPHTEQVVENKRSGENRAVEVIERDSLRREVIIREESITRHSRQRNGVHPMATSRGNLFMGIDLIFYMLAAMLFLTIMTHQPLRKNAGGGFGRKVVVAVAVLVVAYLLAPQMTWRGDIIITANARHLFNPMTLLKLTATFVVCVLYGKIYELLYAKQVVEMENEKLKNENLTWQYNTLINQVNPHFLFNSLNSLSMLVREQKTDSALTYIGQMSDTYRYIIEEGEAEKTTVGEELRFVEAYGYLLEIRYAGKLHIRADVGEEYHSWQMPPLSIQPLIENAVKHNTITSSLPMEITITAEDGYIVVSNPINPKLQAEESTGIGLRNLSSRYELITGHTIEVVENGEMFIVKLPLIRPAK